MKRKCEKCTHYKCFINKYCSPEWKPLITYYKTSSDYKAGEAIFNQGDNVEGIYQIYSGKIKVVSDHNTPNERIVRLAKSEELLGHRGIGGRMKYPVSAIALEDSQVTFIPIDIFNKTVKANPEFSFNLLMFFADEFKKSEMRMKIMSSMLAKEKVAMAILNIVNAFGFDENDPQLLAYTPTRKEIAAIAGTTYETVIRELSRLERSEIIIQVGKSIKVKNLEYLKSLCKTDQI